MKERKLIWWDGEQKKIAKGTSYEIERDEDGQIVHIVFHGHEGDIVFGANAFNGRWMIH